jgi:hypothetical protein
MALTWFLGVQGFTSAYETISHLRSGTSAEASSLTQAARDAADAAQILAVYKAARLHAIGELYRVTFPLGVAHVLLAGLLVIASGLAMTGRPGARSLALQALAANALLAVVDYALTQPVRAAWIDAVLRARDVAPPALRGDVTLRPEHLYWFNRVSLALDLATLALAAFALTRRRTRTYFEAVAHAVRQAEDS